MTVFNTFQTVKRKFFAMRNGIIADTLRKSGSPYKIIFGLNMPQLQEIAAEFKNKEGLADRLWQNNTTRESVLLAPMIMDISELTIPRSIKLIEESPDVECLDMLIHNLFRKYNCKEKLAEIIIDNDNWKLRYTAMRLAWTFIGTNPLLAQKLAETEKNRKDARTLKLAQKILSLNDAW